MINTLALRARNRKTLDSVFAHPTAHNLAWYDVMSLLEQLGEVSHAANGKLRATVTGRSVAWEPAGPQLSTAEVHQLRHFLQAVEATPSREEPAMLAPEAGHPRRAAVVITYRDAQVHVGGEVVRVEPFDPRGRLQHLHEKAGHVDGKYLQPQPEYYARVADAIRGFDQILLLGHGKGHSSALAALAAYLDRHEPELAPCVVGRMDLDGGELTEAGVEQAVQEFFAVDDPSRL
jgi:hypothetical protein